MLGVAWHLVFFPGRCPAVDILTPVDRLTGAEVARLSAEKGPPELGEGRARHRRPPPSSGTFSESEYRAILDRIEVVQECSAWYGGWTGRPALRSEPQ